MGITEELKSLEEMKAKGTLTEAEFAAAKAATISKHEQASTVQSSVQKQERKKSGIASKVIVLAVVIVGVWFVVQSNTNGKPTTEVLKAAARMPVDLTNEVENLRASSQKVVPIQLPYDGSLTVSMQVQRGNPVEVFVTDNSGVEKLNASNRQASYFGGFYAAKAMTFQHTERLSQGTYYVVMRDSSLGILSASTSDVSLKVRLEP